jgi:hypothetical protein
MVQRNFLKPKSPLFKYVTLYIAMCFVILCVGVQPLHAELLLPTSQIAPITLSQTSAPAMLKGIRINPNNLFNIEFVIDPGDQKIIPSSETSRLIQYFLAGLTMPQKDIWVNLSPYESTRIMKDELARTDLGKDLLIGDYVLKQLAASLTDPRSALGKEFWSTDDRTSKDFHKVWITPQHANVITTDQAAFIQSASLNVLTEDDYKARGLQDLRPRNASQDVFKQIILPKIKYDVNNGKNFDRIRQIYHALILGMWFKQKLQHSIYQSVYFDQKKIGGIDLKDMRIKEKIYKQYIQAFKKGVYNYIKEDYDPLTQKMIPRRYFSGGFDLGKTSTWLNFKPRHHNDRPINISSNGLQSLNVALEQVHKPRKWFTSAALAVSLSLVGLMSFSSSVSAATYEMPNPTTIVATVEKNDTVGGMLRELGKATSKADNNQYKSSVLSKKLWGENGSVKEIFKSKNMDAIKVGQQIIINLDKPFSQKIIDHVKRTESSSIAQSAGGTPPPPKSLKPQIVPSTVQQSMPVVAPAPAISIATPSASTSAATLPTDFWSELKRGLSASTDILFSVPCLLFFFIFFDYIKKRNNKDLTEIEKFLNSFSEYLNSIADKDLGMKKNKKPFSGLSKLAFTSAQRLGDGRIQVVFQTGELLPRNVRNGKSDLIRFFARPNGILSKQLKLSLSSNGGSYALEEEHLNSVEMLKTGFVLNFNPPEGAIPPKEDEHLNIDYEFSKATEGGVSIALDNDPVRGVMLEWEEALNSYNGSMAPLRNVITKIYALQQQRNWLSFTDIQNDSSRSGKMMSLNEQTNEVLSKSRSPEREFFLRLQQHLHWDQRMRDQITVIYRDKNRDLAEGDPLSKKVLFFFSSYPLDKLLRIVFLKEYFRNKAIKKGREEILPEYYKTRYAVYELSKRITLGDDNPSKGFNVTLEQLRRGFDDYVYNLEKINLLGSVGRNPSERHNRVIRSAILLGTLLTTTVLWGFGIADYRLIIGQLIFLGGAFWAIPSFTDSWLSKRAKAHAYDRILLPPQEDGLLGSNQERSERDFLSILRDKYLRGIVPSVKPQQLNFVRALTQFIDLKAAYVNAHTVKVTIRADGYMPGSSNVSKALRTKLGEQIRVFVNQQEVAFEDMDVEVKAHDINIILRHVGSIQAAPQLTIKYFDDSVEKQLSLPVGAVKEEMLFEFWRDVNQQKSVKSLPLLFSDVRKYLSEHPFDVLNTQSNAIIYYKMRQLSYDMIKILKVNEEPLRQTLPPEGYETLLGYFVNISLMSNSIRETSANLITMQTYASRFFHESMPYGGTLGRVQRPLMGVYYHYLKAKDDIDGSLKKIIKYKNRLLDIEVKGLQVFNQKAHALQTGFDLKKMQGKIAGYDHRIRHPRKYSQVGATVVRSLQRMISMTTVLIFTAFNILFFPIVDGVIMLTGATMPVFLSDLREGLNAPVFQSLGLGDIFVYISLLSPWVIYMHAQMNTQWESFSYHKSLDNLLKNKWTKASLWSSHIFQNIYKMSYFTALAFSFKITLGLNFLQTLYTSLDTYKKNKLKQERRKPQIKPILVGDSAQVSKANVTLTANETIGGIDMDLEKFGIKVNTLVNSKQPLTILPENFEGFGFRILNIAPMKVGINDFLTPISL